MAKKQERTPRSRVRAALRQLWLRSRERAAAIKRDKYTCQCGKKQSKAKGREFRIEVHHIHGVQWEPLIDLVYEHLLTHPVNLETLCVDCHNNKHKLNINIKYK